MNYLKMQEFLGLRPGTSTLIPVICFKLFVLFVCFLDWFRLNMNLFNSSRDGPAAADEIFEWP